MAMTQAQREALPRDLAILNDMADAKRQGDTATYRALLSQLQPPAWTLLGIKRAGHADYIRRARLDTSLADAEFGEGWLDREE